MKIKESKKKLFIIQFKTVINLKIMSLVMIHYCFIVKNIITNQDILKGLFSDRYPYILIDEYQDTDEKVVAIIDSIREYSNSRKKVSSRFFW